MMPPGGCFGTILKTQHFKYTISLFEKKNQGIFLHMKPM